MGGKSMRRSSAAALFFVYGLAAVLCAPAAAGEPAQNTFEIGRRHKIAPRLEAREDVPHFAVNYQDLRVARDIPASTEYYTIHPKVRASAFSYFFHVRGYYGRFTVGTVVNLAKFVHELAILEEIRHGSSGIDFRSIAKRLRQTMGQPDGDPGFATDNLSLSDELNLDDIPEQQPDEKPEESVGVDESGVDRSELGYGPNGEANRAVAYDLGVDVYTSNVILKEVIRELGRMKVEDSMGWVVPSYVKKKNDLYLIYGDAATERRIRDNSPAALRKLVRQELETIFMENVEDLSDTLTKLFSNPNHSPRNIAYIGTDCQSLSNVVNLSLLLPDLAGAETPEEADMQTVLLRFYSLFHQYIQPIRGFTPIRKITAAIGTNGYIYMFFWGDTMLPWRLTANSFPIISEEAESMDAVGAEFWTLGDADPRMVDIADKLGITIHQNAIYDPRFHPETNESWME